MIDEPIRIGLALSGGTAKSVAHIGVIKAFEEAGIEILRLAGTSGGAIISSYYASGMSTDRIAELAQQTKLTDLGGIGFRRLGFFSSNKLYRMLCDQLGTTTFADLRIPLGIVVTNLQNGAREVIESGPVARAAQASACIPQIYAPVEMNGMLYVDGGLVEYMPTGALVSHQMPLIVGVNLGYHRDTERPRHILGLIMQMMGIVAQRNAVMSERLAHVVIKPDLRRFNPFEIREAEAMIQVGYDEAKRRIPDIERAWSEAHSTKSRIAGWWRRTVRGEEESTLARQTPTN